MNAVSALDRGIQHHLAGDLDAAQTSYLLAIFEDRQNFQARTNLGAIHQARREFDAAMRWHNEALRFAPSPKDLAIAHNNIGTVLNAQCRYEDAVAAYTIALENDPENVTSLGNIGDSLCQLGRYEEALERIQKALSIKPDFPEAYCNLGFAYWGMGRNEAALGAFRVSLALSPMLAPALRNYGIALLQCGQFAEGWRGYSWRFAADNALVRPFTCPMWDGGPVKGSLLVWSEQGLGDEILHASMIPDLLERGIDVVWEAEPRLVDLLQRSNPGIRVIPRQDPPVDVSGVVTQIPSGSLGMHLRPSKESFPGRPYLKAGRIEEMRQRIGARPGEKIVGISWRSSSASLGVKKSTSLSDWADVLRVPGVKFVDLQYGKPETHPNLKRVDGLDLSNDMDGVAALTSCCDLVITVSNTVAHLSAALGIPTLVLVSASGGRLWYWGTEDKTPWYTCVDIIRQRHGERWDVPLCLAAARLRHFLKTEN